MLLIVKSVRVYDNPTGLRLLEGKGHFNHPQFLQFIKHARVVPFSIVVKVGTEISLAPDIDGGVRRLATLR